MNDKPAPIFSAPDRQGAIYLKGFTGQKPAIPTDLNQLAALAQKNMSKEAFAYIAGGAGIEDTIRNNRNAFNQWKIIPRMLRDVSEYDLSTAILNTKLSAPLLLSPVGVLEMAHKEADLAVAKAASNLGIPMIFSNQASVEMEKTAAVMGESPRWFQLYWSKSNELVQSFVERADAAGCEAIVVTLDTTMLGWRIQDLDLAYLPFLRGKGIAQYISDPVFQRLIDEPETEDVPQPKTRLNWDTIYSIYELMSSYPGGFFNNLRSRRPLKAVRKFTSIYTNPALNWEHLGFLRTITKRPILLKGILHPEDARKAIDYGMDGIIVSNHGGRQVDGSISTIEALPEVVKAVNQQIPVIMDSGIRGGADMFKALALGAKAVCIGRPFAYALAIAGTAGVKTMLQNLIADFELTMRLSGCKNLEEININCLIKA